MKKMVLFTVLFVGIIFLAGCKKAEKEPSIVGKWEYESGSFIYTFKKDKTCSYDFGSSSMKCTYEIDGDKLSILYDGNSTSFDTTFEIKDNVLTIKDSLGNDVRYKKK